MSCTSTADIPDHINVSSYKSSSKALYNNSSTTEKWRGKKKFTLQRQKYGVSPSSRIALAMMCGQHLRTSWKSPGETKNFQDVLNITNVRLFALEDSSGAGAKCFKMQTKYTAEAVLFQPKPLTNQSSSRKLSAECVHALTLPALCRFRRPNIYLLRMLENPMELT